MRELENQFYNYLRWCCDNNKKPQDAKVLNEYVEHMKGKK